MVMSCVLGATARGQRSALLRQQTPRSIWKSFFRALLLSILLFGSATSAASSTMTSAATDAAASSPTYPSSQVDVGGQENGGGNPVGQLAGYVRDSVLNFKNGMVQLYSDHQKCNSIRSKQSDFAKANGLKRRGWRGNEMGGISYAEYDFLKKGLVDRRKVLSLAAVATFTPNLFVYIFWCFPHMLPSPFLRGGDPTEISRERAHAVVTTLLDIEKGAHVAPAVSKLNPFGRKSTERAMERLGRFGETAGSLLSTNGATGAAGADAVLNALRNEVYTIEEPTKKSIYLSNIPRPILKGLKRAIQADPSTKGASLLGGNVLDHVRKVELADEFLVNQKVDMGSLGGKLLMEACTARLIGAPGCTDEELRDLLLSWLQHTVIEPREEIQKGGTHFNGNLARAALMCYHALDGARDSRSATYLPRLMYQGQMTSKSQGKDDESDDAAVTERKRRRGKREKNAN